MGGSGHQGGLALCGSDPGVRGRGKGDSLGVEIGVGSSRDRTGCDVGSWLAGQVRRHPDDLRISKVGKPILLATTIPAVDDSARRWQASPLSPLNNNNTIFLLSNICKVVCIGVMCTSTIG